MSADTSQHHNSHNNNNEHHDSNRYCHALATIAKAWRISGLLSAISAEELKSWLLVFSFTDAQGHCQPTLPQLAHAMQVSEAKARRRLERLLNFSWRGQVLAKAVTRDNNFDAYQPVLSPRLFFPQFSPQSDQSEPHPEQYTPEQHAGRQGKNLPAQPRVQQQGVQAQPLSRKERMSRKEWIIELSRLKYGRPREEVERFIYEQMGWQYPTRPQPDKPPPSKPPLLPRQKTLRQRLLEVGVDEEGADVLLQHFDAKRIMRQLDWLPYRRARDPAAFLVAAIEEDYEEPKSLQREKA